MQEFVWKQTEQDQLESLRIQTRRVIRMPYYRSGRRNIMITMIAVGAAPMLVVLLSNWDDQDAFSLGGVALILALLVYFLVVKEPGSRSLDRAADKQAERYMRSLDVIPTGPHRCGSAMAVSSGNGSKPSC